ncbi:reverse transcriptase domain-containing protein [Tanacetum coccineum]
MSRKTNNNRESSKKQKMEEDKESDEVEEVSEDDEGELLKHLVIKKDEDIAIDAIPLATKLLVIVDYKLHKEGMLVHYQLIRADGSSKRYSSMIRMLQGIDREDLEVLWVVKAYGKTAERGGLLRFERLQGHLRFLLHKYIMETILSSTGSIKLPLLVTNVIDHSALKHLFKKQDAKPHLIRWILLIQEFDIEIKDIKGTGNVAADHLSQIRNDESSDDSEVDDNFPRETLMEINTKDELWFADFANYLVADIIPKEMTYQQKKKFFSDLKHYFWEEPYLFKTVKDNLAIWSRKLDDALWAFRTAYKTPTGTTPYKLIYGKNCHLPFEIEHRAYWDLKNCNPDLIAAGEMF